MHNIAMALGLGVLTFAVLYVPGLLRFGESVVPGVLVSMAAYFVLARQTFRKVERIFAEATQALQAVPPRFELAIATMQKAYLYAPRQLGVRSQVDTQIGVIYFLQKEFRKAEPYLKRSLGFGHWLGAAMLAVVYYKRKDHDQMRKTFDVVLKRGKKHGLAWNLCAYLYCQVGDRAAAQRVLVEGLKKTKGDAKIQETLLALQNGKKLKMRSYKEQWYQFHLERPPQEYQQVAFGGRPNKAARRGRW
jgi:tetratricopeptide (TPR) repeat protein